VRTYPTSLGGCLLIEPDTFEDDRGFFLESWNLAAFEDLTGFDTAFVQDNHSGSKGGVLRGLHYQLPPHPQGKLVRVVVGAVFDVAVDLRRSSPTFGDWFGTELTAENRTQLWIPPGFAHGFLALSDWAEVLYKTTDYYAPDLDRSIRWDDPDIGIEWPIDGEPVLSDKDAGAPALGDAEVFA
jgi:dTDP-4-dehydrorhamnose 3,5-epimerase